MSAESESTCLAIVSRISSEAAIRIDALLNQIDLMSCSPEHVTKLLQDTQTRIGELVFLRQELQRLIEFEKTHSAPQVESENGPIDWDAEFPGVTHQIDGNFGLYVTPYGTVLERSRNTRVTFESNGVRHWYPEAHHEIRTEARRLLRLAGFLQPEVESES